MQPGHRDKVHEPDEVKANAALREPQKMPLQIQEEAWDEEEVAIGASDSSLDPETSKRFRYFTINQNEW